MKQYLLPLVILCSATTLPLHAQQSVVPTDTTSVAVVNASIVSHLEERGVSGTVRIVHDPRLTQRIGEYGTGKNIKYVDGVPTFSIPGYRIQVFSDNDQRKSKEEALSREDQLKEYDPTIDTYVIFTTPFWRLRAGNYRSFEEANDALRKLRQAFPKFAKEMRIINEYIVLPIGSEEK